jgi:molybdate transport system permease protein
MDWTAFALSIELAAWTAALLLPAALFVARRLAWGRSRLRPIAEALVALPLVLPPTVLGYYLLVSFGAASPLGAAWERVFGRGLAFSFAGLVAASVLINIPFAVQPMQRAFESIPRDVREAAWVSGLSSWRAFWMIELPLAWPGILSALVLTFAHTMGEFGVVLMVGGAIPGETRTASLAIYDRSQAFDSYGAGVMSAALLGVSIVAIAAVVALTQRVGRRHD